MYVKNKIICIPEYLQSPPDVLTFFLRTCRCAIYSQKKNSKRYETRGTYLYKFSSVNCHVLCKYLDCARGYCLERSRTSAPLRYEFSLSKFTATNMGVVCITQRERFLIFIVRRLLAQYKESLC